MAARHPWQSSKLYPSRQVFNRGYIPDDGKWVLAVPTLDYGEPYPLPPAPETIKFVFNANMTMQNTTSYAYITKTVVHVDLPLYLVVLLAIFVAVAIIGLYIRKRPSVQYFDCPLLKLIAAPTSTRSSSGHDLKTPEVTYNVVFSEKPNCSKLLSMEHFLYENLLPNCMTRRHS